MCIDEGEEVQIKGIENIFNRINSGKLPYLKKDLVIQVKESFRTLNRQDQ
jgi:hypothetical protein